MRSKSFRCSPRLLGVPSPDQDRERSPDHQDGRKCEDAIGDREQPSEPRDEVIAGESSQKRRQHVSADVIPRQRAEKADRPVRQRRQSAQEDTQERARPEHRDGDPYQA